MRKIVSNALADTALTTAIKPIRSKFTLYMCIFHVTSGQG